VQHFVVSMKVKRLCGMIVAETRAGISVQAWQAVTWRCTAARCRNTTQTVPARASDATANIWIPWGLCSSR